MLTASCTADITIAYKNFTADIAGCADISGISTANSVASDTNIAACTAYACFLYNAFPSAFTAYACSLYNAFAYAFTTELPRSANTTSDWETPNILAEGSLSEMSP